MENYRIALVEDNMVNRNSFLQKVNGMTNLSLVFVAENGNRCLEELARLHHDRLPQVVFMDIEMPLMDGIQAIRMAKALYPHIHFLVLTVFDDDEKVFDAIRAGASGYLLKQEPIGTIVDAITNVLQYGGAPMSPAIARKTLRLLSHLTATDQLLVTEKQELPSLLTEREKEVLRHLVNGWDAKRIGVALGISYLTIRKHMDNIYHKLHINSQAQAISLAHKHKWL